jgi:hypothetical protein
MIEWAAAGCYPAVLRVFRKSTFRVHWDRPELRPLLNPIELGILFLSVDGALRRIRACRKVVGQCWLGHLCTLRRLLMALPVDQVQQVNGSARVTEGPMMIVEFDSVDFAELSIGPLIADCCQAPS